MQYGSLSIGLALAACLGVSGCGEKRTLGEEPVPVQRSECGGIFVLAPASYMQYIQHDEATLLASEGRYEDLPVFCTEEMARMLEERLEHDHELLPASGACTDLRAYGKRMSWKCGPANGVCAARPSLSRFRHLEI